MYTCVSGMNEKIENQIIIDITDNHYINNFNMQLDVIFINKLHPFNIVVNELLMKK